MGALIIGFSSAVVCYIAATSLKRALGYDDSLDVFGVHGDSRAVRWPIDPPRGSRAGDRLESEVRMEIDPRAWKVLLREAHKRPGKVIRITHDKGG